ncbi:Rv3212 family protein [Jongsikchunia kroppenstedtii]|uniref:Rv3212 family protein n=1 Tax=Jongsikchunia kroppenstedtii TaxID=1121721 RepID=UPI000379F449|nr:hypothetical protein [Jongsikchunia kroppenstedtii]
MLKPERRKPVDLIVTAIILLVIVVVGVAIWATSPVRETTESVAGTSINPAPPATAAPAGVEVAWTAPATAVDVADGLVITSKGNTVAGHDPADGRVLWHYRRDIPLCGLVARSSFGFPTGGSDSYVVAAFRNSRGCGEVTALRARDGFRGPTRSSLADKSVTLSSDGDLVLSQGDTRLEAWRSDLVRTIEYGRVQAPVNPDSQPEWERGGRCTLLSSAINSGRLAVIERCPRDAGYRLSILAASGQDDDKPEPYSSTVITSGTNTPPPQIIAVASTGVSVFVPAGSTVGDTAPAVANFGMDGHRTTAATVEAPANVPAGNLPHTSGGLVMFWTGQATVVLDATTLAVKFQTPGATGTGVVMGTDLVLPTVGGFSVHDAATGAHRASIPFGANTNAATPVVLRAVGSSIVEQSGDTVTVLRPRPAPPQATAGPAQPSSVTSSAPDQ